MEKLIKTKRSKKVPNHGKKVRNYGKALLLLVSFRKCDTNSSL